MGLFTKRSGAWFKGMVDLHNAKTPSQQAKAQLRLQKAFDSLVEVALSKVLYDAVDRRTFAEMEKFSAKLFPNKSNRSA